MRRAALAASVLGLCACHGSSWHSLVGDNAKPATAPAGPVAVQVNADAITVDEIDARLKNLPPNLSDAQKSALTGKATIDLVDQELLLQHALDAGLDREPDVAAEIDAARRRLLAQAYLQKKVLVYVHPSEEEIREYYAANPALFAERRVYALEKLDVPAITAEQGAALQALVAHVKSPGDVTQWLAANHIAYTASNGVRGAEDLPLALLPKLAAMPDGQLGVLIGNGTATVIRRAHSESQPVSLETARPAIARFLANRQGDERAREEVLRLRQGAKLEFLGDFAKYRDLALAQTARPASAQPATPGASSAQ
jgi:EpsD family peptidyl-prolyl cis-trans isomerase